MTKRVRANRSLSGRREWQPCSVLHIAVAVAASGPTLVQSAPETLQSAAGCNRQGAVGPRDNHGLVTAVERFNRDRLQHRSVAHRACGVFWPV